MLVAKTPCGALRNTLWWKRKAESEKQKRKRKQTAKAKATEKSEKRGKTMQKNTLFTADNGNTDYTDEELFCQTYVAEDFETAIEEFNSELEEATYTDEDDIFDESDTLAEWLEAHKNDSALLKEAWDTDLWNNSVSELANQCYLQFGTVNSTSVKAVLSQWQADLNG